MTNNITGPSDPVRIVWPRVFNTIFYGGLAAGVGDGLFALIFYGLINGAKPIRIFQSVASGLLGKAAFDGGVATFSLGVLLHFIVAMCIATVFYLASSTWPALLRHAIFCGLIYGMIAYLGMSYIVIPLSAARHGTSIYLTLSLRSSGTRSWLVCRLR